MKPKEFDKNMWTDNINRDHFNVKRETFSFRYSSQRRHNLQDLRKSSEPSFRDEKAHGKNSRLRRRGRSTTVRKPRRRLKFELKNRPSYQCPKAIVNIESQL